MTLSPMSDSIMNDRNFLLSPTTAHTKKTAYKQVSN
jgi:hypothetical protein